MIHMPKVKTVFKVVELGVTPGWSGQNGITSSDVQRPLGELLCMDLPWSPCSLWGQEPSPLYELRQELPLGLTCVCPRRQGSQLPHPTSQPWSRPCRFGRGPGLHKQTPSIPQAKQALMKPQLGCFRLNWPLFWEKEMTGGRPRMAKYGLASQLTSGLWGKGCWGQDRWFVCLFVFLSMFFINSF